MGAGVLGEIDRDGLLACEGGHRFSQRVSSAGDGEDATTVIHVRVDVENPSFPCVHDVDEAVDGAPVVAFRDVWDRDECHRALP